MLFGNPANQLVPVTLDADSPTDLLVIEGASSQLRVINRGSAATYQWRKKDGLGVPQNIPGATLDRLFLNNITPAEAGEYSAVVTNAVDNATSRTATVTVLPPVALDVALDTPGRTWTTGGSKPWVGFASTTLAHDTVDAAMPTTLARGETAWLETTVTGPISVSYRWKSANPTFGDFYQFTIDGDPAGYINGDHDWTLVQHSLGAGTHTLRWSFNKSTEVTGGNVNTVYLDQIAFATMPDIVVELDPGENLLDGLSDIDFLTALPGGNRVRHFTIRNNGSAQLNSLVINKNGLHAGLFTVSPLSSTTVEPGDTATFSITFAPDTADTKYASIQIISNDSDESPFHIDLRGTGGVPITSWRQTHFGTTANTGDAADDADADGDGVPNLLEFATEGTPGASDKEPGEMAPLDGSGSIYFTYTRNKQAMGEITFQVEWADDLLGPWSTSDVVQSVISDDGLVQTVIATLPTGSSGHRFVRLRVSR